MDEPWSEQMCDTCGVKPKRVTAVGRSKECETCGRYRRRTGRQRPPELILRQLEREQKAEGDTP